MKQIYAIAQQKGGVGKTTSVINLGAALAERGHRVLLVDLDPQGALSAGLGVDPLKLTTSVYDVLRTPDFAMERIITPPRAGCALAPANIDLAASELELVSEPGRETILKGKLAPLHDAFDYVLIDCPPSLSLLTLNALAAASRVIIPVQTQYLALRGMDLLLQTIEKVRERINPSLSIAGILATMFNGRTTHSREVVEELHTTYGNQLFKTIIPTTVKLQDSAMAGESILQFTPQSPATQAYRELAEEVEARG
ncbi:MAG: ParA family protein [Abitibacteriaceae bacterium]|nr:ParA family protein [Abditibacteriaceae bacterium]